MAISQDISHSVFISSLIRMGLLDQTIAILWLKALEYGCTHNTQSHSGEPLVMNKYKYIIQE